MKTLAALVAALTISSGITALAASELRCTEKGSRVMVPGQSCVTSSGTTFTLLERTEAGQEAWKDESSGLVWTDRIGSHDRDNAKAACADLARPAFRFELPDRKAFESAENHGFREALPRMRDHFYWSATAAKGSSNVRYVFNGNFGKLFPVVYRNIAYVSVRCVGIPR